MAVDLARRLIHRTERVPFCVVAGVDSFLVGPTLAAYEATHRFPDGRQLQRLPFLARRGRPYCWDPQGRLAFRNSAALPSVSAGSARDLWTPRSPLHHRRAG